MYMTRLTLRTDGTRLSDLGRMDVGNPYRIHQTLWKLFDSDPDNDRAFLYRQDQDRGRPRFLLVSQRPPVDSSGLWDTETKEYTPQLASGQALAFSLRVNPVVTRRDEAGRQHRHDVVMDLKRHLREQGEETRQPDLVQQAARQWLQDRATRLGFTLEGETFLAEGYRQHELIKGKGRRIRFSTVDCTGVLQVSDSERLTAALYGGIGPAKAFGCGLLLVRRA